MAQVEEMVRRDVRSGLVVDNSRGRQARALSRPSRRQAGAVDVVDLRSVRGSPMARTPATPPRPPGYSGAVSVDRNWTAPRRLRRRPAPGRELAEVGLRTSSRIPRARWRSSHGDADRGCAAGASVEAERRCAVAGLGPSRVGDERERDWRFRDARGGGNVCDGWSTDLLRQPCLQRPTDRSAAMARVGGDPARVCKLGRRI
jgi:hypothetical protein